MLSFGILRLINYFSQKKKRYLIRTCYAYRYSYIYVLHRQLLTVLQTGLIYVQFDVRYYACPKGDTIDILKE